MYDASFRLGVVSVSWENLLLVALYKHHTNSIGVYCATYNSLPRYLELSRRPDHQSERTQPCTWFHSTSKGR
jgi:hypothetical protein